MVACLEAPLELERLLGLEPGGAYVLRNAGGVVTDDVIRSLCLCQRLHGAREVVVVQHTDCPLELDAEVGCAAAVARLTERAAPGAVELFRDVDEDVRVAFARIERSPLLELIESLRGLVFDDASGRLRQVASPARELGA